MNNEIDLELENDIKNEQIENSVLAIDVMVIMALNKLDKFFKNKNDKIEFFRLLNNRINERIFDSLKD